MADTTLLTKVKSALGVSGTYTDDAISVYIDEVVDYMRGAGVSPQASTATMENSVEIP